MMRELRDTTASIYFLPDMFAFEMIQGRLIDINGIPALSVCETPLLGMNAIVKRAFDIVAAGLALLAAAPADGAGRRGGEAHLARSGAVPPAPLRPERRATSTSTSSAA